MFKTIIILIISLLTIQSLPINKTNTTLLGGCIGTQYGCCQDIYTACTTFNCSNCQTTELIGGCEGTKYGCCPDNINPCYNLNCSLGCTNAYVQ